MRLSTSSNLCEYANSDFSEFAYTVPESLEMIKNGGFGAGDICFCTFCRGTLPMTQDNWKDWVEEIAKGQQRTGLPLSQSHAHFYDYDRSSDPDRDDELVRRTIEAAGMLNIPWITVHPQGLSEECYSVGKNRELNRRLLVKYGEWAVKYGVGLAVENMIERRSGGRRYCAQAEELVDLVDSMNDPKLFGITWDTGHAHLSHVNQGEALRLIGKRLKATHIADNKGEHDDHMLPFMGTIKWDEVMQALAEIGYEGDFTYETFAFSNPLPKELRAQAVKYACEVGMYLLSRV